MRLAHDLSEFDPPPALGQSRSCEQPVTAVIPTTNENENTLGRCPIRHDLIDGSAQQKLLSFSCDGLSGNVHEVLSRVGAQRSENAEHSSPRELLGSGIDADNPARVLVVKRARYRPQRRHLGEVAILIDIIETLAIIVDKVEADVMNLQLSAIAGGRVSNMAPLEAGKGYGVCGVNTGLHLTRIRI